MIYENEIVSYTYPSNQISHTQICNEMLTKLLKIGFSSFVYIYEEPKEMLKFCLDKLNSVSGTVSYAH